RDARPGLAEPRPPLRPAPGALSAAARLSGWRHAHPQQLVRRTPVARRRVHPEEALDLVVQRALRETMGGVEIEHLAREPEAFPAGLQPRQRREIGPPRP